MSECGCGCQHGAPIGQARFSGPGLTSPIRAGKSLDAKLANLHANASRATDFILADAKDADMATGLAATGVDPATGKRRSLADYRDQMREITRQGLVDIMLMSCSTSEQLTIRERLFENSTVTPAVRANDTTDIHLPAGGTYSSEPSRPFRSATIEQIQSGKVNPTPDERRLGADLGLYSITPNNRLEFDYPTLHAYRDFRIEAEAKGFRHFLEVFDPNACADKCPADLGRFINDLIARTLAGVPSRGRPIFLKIAYHGPRAMEELVAYDPTLIVGVLGGSAGTTFDAFKLLEDAKKYGARAALFGRKINNAEHQLTFVRFLHAIANDQLGAEEATRAYHGELERLKIKPLRSLNDDLRTTDQTASYAGSRMRTTTVSPGASSSPQRPRPRVTMSTSSSAGVSRPAPRTTGSPAVAAAVISKPSDGHVDFAKMTSAEKVAYARARLRKDIERANGDGTFRRAGD